MPEPLPMIGWREYVQLPELGLPIIKAKTDTGARTSCLHVADYQLVEDVVHFTIDTPEGEQKCHAPLSDQRRVRDSGGHESLRPFIKTRLVIGAHAFHAELSLTQRHGMKFRMLLGRTALASRFLVDPSANYLLGKRPPR